MVYIASQGNAIPLYASVQSPRIAFDGRFVKAGYSKDKFIEKWHMNKDMPDVIRITDQEGGNEFTMIFSNNILERVIYNSLYVE